MPDIFLTVHRELTIELAARYQVPTLYQYRYFAAAGGLMSYGTDVLDQYARAAEYIDRILKGTKLADLPMQVPTRYQLVINLKAAKGLGLEIPPRLFALADEVIDRSLEPTARRLLRRICRLLARMRRAAMSAFDERTHLGHWETDAI